jgi:hypothetical protein
MLFIRQQRRCYAENVLTDLRSDDQSDFLLFENPSIGEGTTGLFDKIGPDSQTIDTGFGTTHADIRHSRQYFGFSSFRAL